MLTSEQVMDYVSQLKNMKDPEAAHMKEDGIYFEVLKAISEGNCEDPKACAAEALESKKIKFPRWYA
jgi:hypothetical protein